MAKPRGTVVGERVPRDECLKCRRPFTAIGRFNRVCPSCAHANMSESGIRVLGVGEARPGRVNRKAPTYS